MSRTGELLAAPAVKELRTVDEPPTDTMALFERLARDPNASVENIERLMGLWERMEARKAESAFNAAMNLAQAEMRPVSADAENPQTRSRYATYAKLDRALRPIYSKHGFALSYDEGESPKPEHVRVLCYVSHTGGHVRTYHRDMPADGKGAKGGDVMTKTHASGAAGSYGARYILKGVFNVAVGEDDRDGNQGAAPEPPKGFEDWVTDMGAVAEQGFPAFAEAWKESTKKKKAFTDYASKYHAQAFAAMKAKAVKVRAS